jgi:hypothetical protein
MPQGRVAGDSGHANPAKLLAIPEGVTYTRPKRHHRLPIVAVMNHVLRPLLVAAMAIAPLLAGLPPAAVDSGRVASLRTPTPAPLDGSREDDAGTPAEQFEQDDLEQEEDRGLLVFAVAPTPPALDSAGRCAGLPDGALVRAPRSRPHSSRGPPRGC